MAMLGYLLGEAADAFRPPGKDREAREREKGKRRLSDTGPPRQETDPDAVRRYAEKSDRDINDFIDKVMPPGNGPRPAPRRGVAAPEPNGGAGPGFDYT